MHLPYPPKPSTPAGLTSCSSNSIVVFFRRFGGLSFLLVVGLSGMVVVVVVVGGGLLVSSARAEPAAGPLARGSRTVAAASASVVFVCLWPAYRRLPGELSCELS